MLHIKIFQIFLVKLMLKIIYKNIFYLNSSRKIGYLLLNFRSGAKTENQLIKKIYTKRLLNLVSKLISH